MYIKMIRNILIRILFFPILLLRRIYTKCKNRQIRGYNNIFSNVKGGSLVVSLENIPGNFEIDIRSHLLQRILINKTYEPDIAALIKMKINPERDAINIGANIGLHTNLISNLINNDRKILAVEPTPLAFNYLMKNIERNGSINKVLYFNGICTNKPGSYTLNSVIGKEEYSSIGETEYITNLNENIVKIQVKGETADYLVAKFNLDPGLILIDVEGAEMKVLEGATNTIKKFKPVIISELVDDFLALQNTSSKEVVDFFNTLDYEVNSIDKRHKLNYPFCGNIIAIPKR
jgi:FkbM family methyltransferase